MFRKVWKRKRGRSSVRARTVKINSNFGANLALVILRHHRDIFKNESPTDHRFSNSTSFKVCDPHLVKFSGLFKEKKVRKKDPFFHILKKRSKTQIRKFRLTPKKVFVRLILVFPREIHKVKNHIVHKLKNNLMLNKTLKILEILKLFRQGYYLRLNPNC